MPFEIVTAAHSTALRAMFRPARTAGEDLARKVAAIIGEVCVRGDEALVEYTQHFDCAAFTPGMLEVEIPQHREVAGLVPPDIEIALQLAKTRVEAFHRRQLPEDIAYEEEDGTTLAFRYVALSSVAAYVPAGTAPLASSVIMNVVPAKLAGVERIAVFCPPQKDGTVHPSIRYACALCGVDQLYAAGGAQAIAAAAYGTQSIRPVDKIVGPGNRFVTEAKRQVQGICGIDGLAGPSEVLVIADDTADVARVCWELLAQAEHDPHARVAVVSESKAFLAKCCAYLKQVNLSALPRGGTIEAVFENGLFLIHAAGLTGIADILEAFAPEHVSLQVQDPALYLPSIRHAGAIFIGQYTPVACGDYLAGTNHVLPTGGSGRFASGLRTLDFMRSFSVLSNSVSRIATDAPHIAALAQFEGLQAHAQTVRMRAS